MTVSELRDLLGHDVLLLAWPTGSKGTRRKWGHFTVASMTPAYLKKVELGNIGVALGEVSGGLVALDVDDDKMVESFLKANPFLAGTLQTHGARGRVFWLRMTGSYPAKTVKLKTRSGGDAGEWRAGKNSQSIIHGTHPDTGNPYQVVNKAKPRVVNFASIVWPPEINNPPMVPCIEEAGRASSHSVPSVSSVASVSSVSSGSSIHCGKLFQIRSLEDVLRRCVPDCVHQNNDLLFNLARGVKTLDQQQGVSFSTERRRDVFEQWHTRSVKFLRPELTKEDYWIEFLHACSSAKYPLGGDAIPTAWNRAQENPPPPEAQQFENPQLRLLVALCRELQILNGEKPFYLSSYSCQQLFGHANHTTAAKWLRVLCVLNIIKVAEKGNTIRATRYRFLGSTQ